jgi:hypothetical protein
MVKRVCWWREGSANSARAKEPLGRGGASVLRGPSERMIEDGERHSGMAVASGGGGDVATGCCGFVYWRSLERATSRCSFTFLLREAGSTASRLPKATLSKLIHMHFGPQFACDQSQPSKHEIAVKCRSRER